MNTFLAQRHLFLPTDNCYNNCHKLCQKNERTTMSQSMRLFISKINREGLAMKGRKILAVLLALTMIVVNTSAIPIETTATETNILTGNNSTFESGLGNWEIFSGGTITNVANPLGEGNVLKFSSPTKTWHTPSINIKELIQDNATEESIVTVIMSIYSPSDMKANVKIRVAAASDLSITEEAGATHITIGTGTVSADTWTQVTAQFTVKEDDLGSTANYWNLCLDGISTYTSELYLDNVQIYIDDAAVTLPNKNTITRPSNAKIGAIRWDGFTESTEGGTDVASQVAKVLEPSKYHNRVPFFGNIASDGTVSFPKYTVDTWEAETEYAVEAGIDYFAYLWYETDDAMSQPRKAHLNSSKKNSIGMCAILETFRSYSTMQELYSAMKEDCYVKINGMPVVYLYSFDNWTAENVLELRQGAARAGIEEALYIVGMIDGTYVLDGTYDKGYDALSWYGTSSLSSGITYAELTQRCMDTISRVSTSVSSNGIDMVPCIATGFDPRPRIETGVSWISGDPNATEDADKPYLNRYAMEGTPTEISQHTTNVLNWQAENTHVTETNLVLAYGWNEHDEGGWLCPTLSVDDNGDVIYDSQGNAEINTSRLDAFAEAIAEYRLTESIAISDDVKVEGYQISATLTDGDGNVGGVRVIGSVEPEINGQTVENWGLIYALNQVGDTTYDISEDDMYIGSNNQYVATYESTSGGLLNKVMGDSQTATYYVRTMTFGGSQADALSAQYSVRAYAKLTDGSYVYSNVSDYSIYRVSNVLYQNVLMSNYAGHQFLYNNILSVVDPTYAEVEYGWGNILVK